MKKLLYLPLICLALINCKQEIKTEIVKEELSIAQKIANAHGYKHWNSVSEIQFTFNVDRDSSHFERSWVWYPKTHRVTSINKNDTIHYNTKEVDSSLTKIDGGFINDKFWLLVPFQLVWDKGAIISEVAKETAPISNNELNKITMTYPHEGGYTPGDAYDIYYDKNCLIKEWIFRKGNQKEPSMITSFENYKSFDGIKIATDHKKNNENWNLYFSNIKLLKN